MNSEIIKEFGVALGNISLNIDSESSIIIANKVMKLLWFREICMFFFGVSVFVIVFCLLIKIKFWKL